MRIAMISEHASPLAATGGVDSGGQNIYVAHVARCLVEQGHRVDVFTRLEGGSQPDVVEVTPGLRVVHVSAGPRAFVPKERLLDHMPEFACFCEEWLRNRPRYDVVHANFFMSGWVGLRLKKTFGLPLVTTFHALGLVRRQHQKEADAFAPARIDIERELAVRSDRIVAECPQDRSDLEHLYSADPARIVTVPCGFDAQEFAPVPRAAARARLGIPEDEFMVLQLGRMVPRKGIETAVRAMAFPRCAGMRLRVVGGDSDIPDPVRTPEIGRLQAVARDCGIGERVVFEGRKTRADLHLWYGACDVFVTTPWYEPFGITPLEAMACARPVVGSAVGGVKFSVVDGVTGLLVPAQDEQALSAALSDLRDDPKRAATMGEAGLRRARAEFTWEGVAQRLSDVFQDAIAGVHGDSAASAGAVPDLATCTAARTTASARSRRATVGHAPRLPASLFHVAGLDAPLMAARCAGKARRPAIFIDKDGTLVEDVPYNVDPARLRFTPHAFPALRLWRQAGYRLVVVTNQSGIERGLFDRAALVRLHDALADRLARAGVPIDGFFACPHVELSACACRKPRAGLLREAARALDIDLRRSWMVGDILDDVEAGHRAGCRSVLLDVGNETQWIAGPMRVPEHRCDHLLDAAQATLANLPRHAVARGMLLGASA